MLRGLLLLCHKNTAPTWYLDRSQCLPPYVRQGQVPVPRALPRRLLLQLSSGSADSQFNCPALPNNTWQATLSSSLFFIFFLVLSHTKRLPDKPQKRRECSNPSGIASNIANFFFYKLSNFQATVAAKCFGK